MGAAVKWEIVDAEKFAAKIRGVAKQWGIDVHFLMREQCRLWVDDLGRMTQPLSREAGIGALAGDLKRIFKPIGDQAMLKWYSDTFSKRLGPQSEVVFNLDGDQSKAAAWHESQQNKRGRVPRNRATQHWTFGKIVIERKMYMPYGSFIKFRRDLGKRVGRLKNGWTPAAKALGSTMNAGWLSTVPFAPEGSFQDAMQPDGSGHISMTNSVPYNERFRNLINITGQRRLRAIGINLQKTLKRIMSQYQLGGSGI